MKPAEQGAVVVCLVDFSGGSQSEPANDVRPPETRRKKKWSDTLRSADLAELMKQGIGASQ